MTTTSTKFGSIGHPPEPKSAHKFLHIARRFFPKVVTFRRYISELNELPAYSEHQISLEPSGDCQAANFNRFLDQLYVAWPCRESFPEGASSEFKARGGVSMDQLLQNVIATTLRRHSSSYAAQQSNVLCNGFSLASDHGCGSMFRNLDAHSSSSPVQILRSPLWKEILNCVGCTILRYLLMNRVVLLSVSESVSKETNKTYLKPLRRLSSVFLQLCGPIPNEYFKSEEKIPSSASCKVLMKRDVMYTNSARRRPVSGTQKTKDLLHGSPSLKFLRNDGLPKSHYLQNLRSIERASKLLLAIIFGAHCDGNAFPEFNSRSVTAQSNLHHNKPSLQVTGRYPPRGGVPDFDLRAKQLSSCLPKERRGKAWLRRRRQSFKRLRDLVPVLGDLIKRTHKFSFRRLLGLTCPLPKSFQRSRGESMCSTEQMIKMDSSPKDVARYLSACTRQMLPTSLFGSPRNRDIFEKGVHTLLRRRSKRESFDVLRFSLHSGIRVTDFTWLHRSGDCGRKICNPTDLNFRRSRIFDLFRWLFWGIVLPIVRQSFYATDSDLGKNRVFFYRREVWTFLIDNAHKSIIRQNKRFNVLSKEELTSYTLKREENMSLAGKGICPYPVLLHNVIRFVPKRSSLRGIQRISGKPLKGFCSPKRQFSTRQGFGSRDGFRDISKAKSCIRRAYRYIGRVLTMEARKDNTAMGASVFSMNDIYDRFLTFKKTWHEERRPKMYVCSIDISTSFDTIPHGALLHDVIPKLLTKQRYAFFRYVLSKPNLSTRRINQRYLVHSCEEPGEEASFLRVVRERLCPRHPGTVFTDLAQVDTLTSDQITLILKEFLLGRNIASIPRRNRRGSETGFAIQSHGVPQGNELSSLLTSLFYAHVENEDLSQFLSCTPRGNNLGRRVDDEGDNTSAREMSLFMRQVDDSIFFTSSASKADEFAERTRKGWKASHGFTVNGGKTKFNFPTASASTSMRRFPWCGLIVDTYLLEITADYSRYGQKEGGRLRDTLSIEKDSRPGHSFAERALTCFKPKLHPLLLDSNINSRSITALNIYQAALLVCLKLSAYAVELQPRDSHLTKVVEATLAMFVRLVVRTVASRRPRSRSCRFSLSQNEVRYLVLHAFRSGISRKLKPRRQMRTRLTHCMGSINKMLRECKCRLTNQEARVQLVAKKISENSCGTFWDMKL